MLKVVGCYMMPVTYNAAHVRFLFLRARLFGSQSAHRNPAHVWSGLAMRRTRNENVECQRTYPY